MAKPAKYSGPLASFTTFLLISVGIVSQIYKNYQTRSTEGLSSLLFILSFFAWTAWAIHGWAIKDRYLAITQTIGAVMTVIILLQFIIYS